MKQVYDDRLQPINGLFRQDDGSLVVKDDNALKRSQAAHNVFDNINNELALLKEQMRVLLENINGKHTI